MDNSIILIDDEQDFLESIKRGLITAGFVNVIAEADPQKAASHIEDGAFYEIALIDITMPGMNGVELLEKIRSNSPDTECIMVTAIDEARMAVECLQKGAYDYLVKPISKEELVSSIIRALERKRLIEIVDLGKRRGVPKLENRQAFKSIVTKSDNVRRVLREAELHAASDVPILITGETGTGKELLARAIHAASPRTEFNFIPINMDGLTGQLFDAEFFGHTKGAFTGALQDRAGYLEHTNEGTLFLDEIGNLPVELQGKLLRVLQDGEFIKLGTSVPRKTDVRFIAATNRDLEKMMVEKAFRKDLYYRLRGGWLHLPPLRERQNDIALLISSFVKDFCGPGGTEVEEDTMAALSSYDYPGNIRELKSLIQAAVNLAQGKPISARHLPEQIRNRKSRSKAKQKVESIQELLLSEVEKNHILKVYHQTGQNKSQAARILGVGLNTLRRRLESYGVD